MKLLSVLIVAAAAGVTSANYLEGNFIPHYRRNAHGPDGDAPKPTATPKVVARFPQGLPKASSAALPKGGVPKPTGAPAAGGMSHGGMRARSPQAPKGPPSGSPKGGAGGLPKPSGAAGGRPKPTGAASGMGGMSHGGMRARSPQAPKGPPSGSPKGGAGGLPKPSGAAGGLPKPTGAAGGMGGMSHGGMRARSPQAPKGMPSGFPKGGAGGLPKPSGAAGGLPKPTGAAGGMGGMSHGGMRARSPQAPKGMPSGFPKAPGAGGLPKSSGAPGAPPSGAAGGMPSKGAGGHSHGGA